MWAAGACVREARFGAAPEHTEHVCGPPSLPMLPSFGAGVCVCVYMFLFVCVRVCVSAHFVVGGGCEHVSRAGPGAADRAEVFGEQVFGRAVVPRWTGRSLIDTCCLNLLCCVQKAAGCAWCGR